jgi:hypothetical protein
MSDRAPPEHRVPLRGRALVRRWVSTVTVAELVGFTLPVLVGGATADAPAGVVLPALLVAGAVEGAALGLGQSLVLRRALPGVPRGRWVGATAGAAALAYLLGLTPSLTASTWAGWPAPLSASVAAVLGVILLGSIGTAQWWFLRGHLPRPWRWIGTTALGWLIGLGTFLAVAMPLWHPGQTLLVTVAVGLLAGTLMAGAMATVTGVALARMLRAP